MMHIANFVILSGAFLGGLMAQPSEEIIILLLIGIFLNLWHLVARKR